MKVRAKTLLCGPFGSIPAGAEFEVDGAVAVQWIRDGAAEPLAVESVETADAKPSAVETTSLPRKTKPKQARGTP